jgi:class 3 adenylate cyclase
VDIGAWLRALGLQQYEQSFRDNAIDPEVLPALTEADLEKLDVLLGHRKKMLAAIAKLGKTRLITDLPRVGEDRFAISAAERRQLTVMFCDLVGSTELASRLDPEDLRAIIGAYYRAIADTVAPFDGFVARYMGDGALVYFGYPCAHEDDAEQAVRAALALIGAAQGIRAAGEKLRLRIGIATGLALVGDLIGTGAEPEETVVGETPNLAARLQTLAEPDTVLIADGTRRLVGSLFDLIDLGPRELRGFAQEQRVWRVAGASTIESRFEALRSKKTPLVGREEELELLLRRWSQSQAREGQVVLLSGEPGIGKSRLTAALQEHLARVPHTCTRHFCSPHHEASALFPFIGQLERAAHFTPDDPPGARLEKLASMLQPAAAEGDISLIAELMSVPGGDHFPPLVLSPQRKKERIFAALLGQLDGLARSQPLLMIFEDLHWIDPTSRELLDLVVARVERLPVLLLVTYRPEFEVAWTDQLHVTFIALNRLGLSASAALVRRLAGENGGLPEDVVDEIVARTDGVPLFIEE